MRGDRPAIEQLRFVPHPSGNAGDTELALLDGKELATITGRGQIQWLYLKWSDPAAWQQFASREKAYTAIREWVSGLDIVPWE